MSDEKTIESVIDDVVDIPAEDIDKQNQDDENEIETSEASIPYNVFANTSNSVPETDEELTEEEREFLDNINEKYKDRNDYEDTPFIEEEHKVFVNSDGELIDCGVDGGQNGSVKSIENGSGDLLEEIIENGTKEITDLPSEESISKELKDTFNLSDEEAAQFMMMLVRIKNGEKFGVYNSLPESLKSMVNSGLMSNHIPPTMENKNFFARSIIDDVLKSIEDDESFIELDKALSEVTKIPNLFDFEVETWQETFEVKLVEAAKACEEEKPAVAKSLIEISEAWKDTYSFRRQYEFLESSESARNRVTKNVRDYSKYVERFLLEAKKSKYIINDVSIVTRALTKYFGDEYSDTIYKAFTILLINTCTGLDFNKPDHVAYISYSIKNLITLEFLDKTRITEFNIKFTENIKKLLDYIVELDNKYQERLNNRPMTKKEKRHANKNK